MGNSVDHGRGKQKRRIALAAAASLLAVGGLAGGLGAALAGGEAEGAVVGQTAELGTENEVTVLTAGQKTEIRTELEAAADARLAGRTGEMREHLRNARVLAEAAGHQGLVQRIHNCRSGLCLITVVQVQINSALKFLERIPTVGTGGGAPASAT